MKLVTVIQFLLTTCIYSQSLENVDFRAEGKMIVVMFDLLHPNADTMMNLELQFKDRQGIAITTKTLSGDLKNVKPGEGKRIIWDVLSDGITLSGKYQAELKIIQYNSVKIGNQVWMTENLNVDRFRNGDLIPEAKTNEEWIKAGNNQQPAWCYNENDPKNGIKYGKLYNWYAVNDPRGLALTGWHIPKDEDWTTLSLFLGGDKISGNKMKSTIGWFNNGNANNSSGFSGLHGGLRSSDGYFDDIFFGYWWSRTEDNTSYAYYRGLNYGNIILYRGISNKGSGLSVRCLRD